MNSLQIYCLAIGSNLAFSTSSMVFSLYARRFSSMWINQLKVFIACLAFLFAMLLTKQTIPLPATTWALLLLSGFSGLCVGDIFLFRAFATLGASRSLVLYSFEPLILGIYGYLFLNQTFTMNQTLSVICMMTCIYIFMLEQNKTTGSWALKSFIWAFLGITLDSIGVMLSRTAYSITPEMDAFEVNVIRCLGALIGFLLINPRSYVGVAKDFWELRKREKSLVITACICGCFLSLSLYLTALKFAHVGTLSAITITGPVWVSLLEHIYYRKLPNLYLVGAFIFFVAGFYLMVIA